MSTTISPAQIEANRRNAQKSTGPRTSEGKAVARFNAVKHGVLARQVVVSGHRFQESPEEFAAFHREFFEHLAPVGPVEEMLVEQIITANWRLRRARTAESAEVALSVDGGIWRRHLVENCRPPGLAVYDHVRYHHTSYGKE